MNWENKGMKRNACKAGAARKSTARTMRLGLMAIAILYGVWKFRKDNRRTAAPQAALSAN